MWTISNWSLVEDLCTKLDADNLTRALANCTHQTVGFVGWARDKMSHIHGTDDYGHSGFLHSFQKPAHSDCDDDHDDERFKGRNDWLDACWLKWLNATHSSGWLAGYAADWLFGSSLVDGSMDGWNLLLAALIVRYLWVDEWRKVFEWLNVVNKTRGPAHMEVLTRNNRMHDDDD